MRTGNDLSNPHMNASSAIPVSLGFSMAGGLSALLSKDLERVVGVCFASGGTILPPNLKHELIRRSCSDQERELERPRSIAVRCTIVVMLAVLKTSSKAGQSSSCPPQLVLRADGEASSNRCRLKREIDCCLAGN